MMSLLKGFLVIIFSIVLVYSLVVGVQHGWNFLEIFFDHIISFTWQGQFNIDFMAYLILSGLWIAWREHYSLNGWLLGLLAGFCGILFFAPYFIYTLHKEKGSLSRVLVGNRVDK